MLNAGENYCMCCGKKQKTNDALWVDHKNKVVFKVNKSGLGYTAECIHYENGKPEKVELKDYSLLNGYPKRVTIEYKCGKEEKRSNLRSSARICPICFNGGEGGIYMKLLPDAGFFPSYFIGLTGVMETGKTVYQNAICRQETFFSSDTTEIRTLFIPDSVSDRYENGYVVAPEPTELQNVECTTFTIRKNFKDVAKIYLVDTAGELCLTNNHEFEGAERAVQFFAEAADAIMLLCDPRSINSRNLDDYRRTREPIRGSVSLVLGDASHRRIPIALVMSGADRLKDIAAAKKGIRDCNEQIVITAGSELLMNKPLTRKNMIRHIYLAKDVLKSWGINTKYSAESGCFIVSSGRDADMNGKKVISYESSSNIKYPITWILNQMGIVDIQ